MLRLRHDKYVYDEAHEFLHMEHVFSGEYILLMDVVLMSDTFLDIQKDIFQEYFSLLVDRLAPESKEKLIRKTVEHTLQELNAKLVLFADKIDRVDYFPLKGAVRVFHHGMLTGSLLGDMSMMIFRDNSLQYAVSNDYDNIERIDLFSEFLEGKVEEGDEMILMGHDIHTVFDKHELKKFNNLFSLQHGDVVDFLEEIMGMRIDMTMATFMLRTLYDTDSVSTPSSSAQVVKSGLAQTAAFTKNLLGRFGGMFTSGAGSASGVAGSWFFGFDWNQYRYPLVIGLLSLLIVGLGISLMGNLSSQQVPLMLGADGVKREVTIEGLKKDLSTFQMMDPTSDQKSHMYKKLIEQLDFLDSEKKWPADAKELRKLVEKSYTKGFNIVYVDSFDELVDGSSSSSSVLSFDSQEVESMGLPLRVFVLDGELHVLGSEGSMLDVIDGDRRGTLVSHTFTNGIDDGFVQCSSNLLRNGAYCVTEGSTLYNVTKAGIEELILDGEGVSFPANIVDLGVFTRSRFYVLTRSLYDNQRDVYVVRYINQPGSQTQFKESTDYPVSVVSGSSLDPQSMTIDTTFLMRDSGQVHQRYRQGNGLTLTDRPINMLGGDLNSLPYSNDVRILTHSETRYIFLFDKENQTLTVYDTVGMKTNDSFATDFSMSYVMRFIFNVPDSILDVAIDSSTANAPVAYILTQKGVHRISLIDFIGQIVDPS